MELNQTKAQEQRAIHGQQSNDQRTLTAGDNEEEQTEETSAMLLRSRREAPIADSEDQKDQEELSPIESVKNAIESSIQAPPAHRIFDSVSGAQSRFWKNILTIRLRKGLFKISLMALKQMRLNRN